MPLIICNVASALHLTILLIPSLYSLRLAMYKGLGFEPVVGKDGRVAKMLVRTL